jgi:predicted DsbA family dithiol-disulfide isomerase
MTNGIQAAPRQDTDVPTSSAQVRITAFTDPACPFAFSAEPDLLGLRWYYGDQIEWTTRLVLLSEVRGEAEARGITLEMIEANDARLANEYGMPINSARRPHLLVAKPPDLAIKAVQLNEPAKADVFIRALRVAWMTDHRPVDDHEVILAVAAETGIDTSDLQRWLAESATEEALESDRRAARDPHVAARALDHKLAGPNDERRYSCPSLEFYAVDDDDRTIAIPGFQSFNAYEAAIANIAPQVVRAAPATDPLEVLEWADWPLAAVEVARAMDTDRETAAARLEEAGAVNERGYWRLP